MFIRISGISVPLIGMYVAIRKLDLTNLIKSDEGRTCLSTIFHAINLRGQASGF